MQCAWNGTSREKIQADSLTPRCWLHRVSHERADPVHHDPARILMWQHNYSGRKGKPQEVPGQSHPVRCGSRGRRRPSARYKSASECQQQEFPKHCLGTSKCQLRPVKRCQHPKMKTKIAERPRPTACAWCAATHTFFLRGREAELAPWPKELEL